MLRDQGATIETLHSNLICQQFGKTYTSTHVPREHLFDTNRIPNPYISSTW